MKLDARLLTAEEVRAELGAEAEGKTDEELTAIARRVRAMTRVLFETRADERAQAARP